MIIYNYTFLSIEFPSLFFKHIIKLIIIGNFGFGIQEHIDLGIKYDPNTGIYGMDFYTCLQRDGKRVTQRKKRNTKLGVFQKVTKEEAQKWFVEKLGGVLV